MHTIIVRINVWGFQFQSPEIKLNLNDFICHTDFIEIIGFKLKSHFPPLKPTQMFKTNKSSENFEIPSIVASLLAHLKFPSHAKHHQTRMSRK